MRRKGFTLVELLVVIVILGIITGISLPIIRNIQLKNEDKKYTTYLDSLKYSGKLYVNSYENDLFGHSKSGCAIIKYSQLEEKNLIKDIGIHDVTCNSEETYVKVVKVDDKFGYATSLGCGTKEKDGSIKIDTKLNVGDLNGIVACGVDNKTIMYFFSDPLESKAINFQRRNVTLYLLSHTGFFEKMSLSYGFLEDKGEELAASLLTPESIIGGWQKLNVNYIGGNEQKRTIEEGNPVILDSTPVTTPEGLTGDYFVIMRIDELKDLAAREWTTDVNVSNYAIFGPFRVDNTKPVFKESSKVISSHEEYHDIQPKLNIEVTDNYTPKEQLKMCISYDTDSCSKEVAIMKQEYEDYNPNKMLEKIQEEYDGSTHTVFVTVADAAGNYETKSYSYKIATRYTISYDVNGGVECSPPNKHVTFDETPPAWGELCSPTKTYYTFQKWKDSAGQVINKDTIATGNITVYAEWKDTTNPTCTIEKIESVTNVGMKVKVVCDDNGDGCKSKQTRNETGVKGKKEFTVEDKAGNKGKCNVTIKEESCYCKDCHHKEEVCVPGTVRTGACASTCTSYYGQCCRGSNMSNITCPDDCYATKTDSCASKKSECVYGCDTCYK